MAEHFWMRNLPKELKENLKKRQEMGWPEEELFRYKDSWLENERELRRMLSNKEPAEPWSPNMWDNSEFLVAPIEE